MYPHICPPHQPDHILTVQLCSNTGTFYTAAWEVISWFGDRRGNMSKSSKMVLSPRCSPDTNPSASCWVVVPRCWNGKLKPGMRFLDPTQFDLSSLTRYHSAAEGSWRKTSVWSGCIRSAVTSTAMISVCVCLGGGLPCISVFQCLFRPRLRSFLSVFLVQSLIL